MLGIYVSGHPLEPYKDKIEKISTMNTIDILNSRDPEEGHLSKVRDGSRVKLAGIVVSKNNKITKNNNMMAFITLEDLVGSIECIVFPMTYEKYNKYINEDDIVVIQGKLNLSEVEEPKLIAEKIGTLEDYNTEKVYLRVTSTSEKDTFEQIKSILLKNNGNTPVYVYMEKDKSTVVADRSMWIDTKNKNSIEELNSYLGEENVKIV